MRYGIFGALVVVAAFTQACGSTVSDGEGVLAINTATGEIREFPAEDEVPEGWSLCEEGECPAPAPCGEIDESACLVRSDCAPLYSAADAYEGCVEGGVDTCDVEECGPQPGMPSYECWDGSIGGSTGRCVAYDDMCGWEVRECPPPAECQPDDCEGPAPGAPNVECSDGSIGGPACIPTSDGVCGWAILECPEDGTCDDVAKCGPALGMPAYLCEDGSVGGNTGVCLDNGDGTCGWEIRECPEESQGG